MGVERRRLLGAMAAAPIAGLAAPAVAQSRTTLITATRWPEDASGPGAMALRLSQRLNVLSAGALQLEVTQIQNPGLDAYADLARGEVDLCLAMEDDWVELSPAYGLFAGTPFGMTADEFEGWIYFGDGANVWTRLAAQSGVKPLLAGDLGLVPTMISLDTPDVQALTNLTANANGIAARFWKTMGVAINKQAPDIVDDPFEGGFSAAERGLRMLSPCVSRPHFALSANFNIPAFEGLSDEHKGLVQLALRSEHMAQRVDAENSKRQAIAAQTVQVTSLVSTQMALAAKELLTMIDAGDAAAKDALWSHQLHLEDARAWSEIGEGAYLNKRRGSEG